MRMREWWTYYSSGAASTPINQITEVKRYSTQLWWAAYCGGHEGVVEILLGHGDVNPNTPDKDGETPVYRAASSGHEGVVKILLRHDKVNSKSPISAANSRALLEMARQKR